MKRADVGKHADTSLRNQLAPRVDEDRVRRFREYRKTLDRGERAELDRVIEYIRSTMRDCANARQFGELMAIELVMALVEYQHSQPGHRIRPR